MDAMDLTPEQALRNAATKIREETKAGNPPPSKALILLVWDDAPGSFDYRFYNSGMKATEMISLCEVHKHKCLGWMDSDTETIHETDS